MDLETLETVPDVFNALGGNRGLEHLTGSKPSAISMWRKANKFPARKYAVMIVALQSKGFNAPASLWGQAERVSA